jgi:hypothetical protein
LTGKDRIVDKTSEYCIGRRQTFGEGCRMLNRRKAEA